MSSFLFNFIGFILLGSVAIVLILGLYTLFKGGETSKKYSNKLMQLRVLLQFIAIIVLVLLAYFFKNSNPKLDPSVGIRCSQFLKICDSIL